MLLRMGKAIDAKFTNVAGSDSSIFCKDRKFEVHELILRGYKYFEKLFSGDWKEARTREIHLEDADVDPVLVEAILKHIYGADVDEVLCCFGGCLVDHRREPSNVQQALVVLDEVEGELEKPTLRKGVWASTICDSRLDSTPGRSRVAVHMLLRLVRLYSLADQYELTELNTMLLARFKSLLSAAWNHSEVLLVIRAIVGTIREGDPMTWVMLEAIRSRLELLVVEPRFMSFLNTTTNAELFSKVGHMTMMKLANERKQVGPALERRYCPFSDDKKGLHCRYNTVFAAEKAKSKTLKCSRCGNTTAEPVERKRLWEAEDGPSNLKRPREDSDMSDSSDASDAD